MNYQSSRGNSSFITAPHAIKMGIAPDGGLFVPDYVPEINKNIFFRMESWSYQERAAYILQSFLNEFSDKEIADCVYGAYNLDSFDDERIAPLLELYERVHIQELWHGPTSAFKDMALQMLPRLLSKSVRKTGENDEMLILVATSGDTGKAALEGFKDVGGIRIIVFFPDDGVSEVQKRQMISQEGQNVHVAAVKGNFDDAQTGVKRIFASKSFATVLSRKGIKMSSANSINWGRLLPQIVYYVSAYVDLKADGKMEQGEGINFVVPTGNFGNILAAYYAMKMGVPVNRLICAANANKVLTDFINTGIYDRKRKFEKTISPSMDILISSNLERLLFEITDHDAVRVSKWMEDLQREGNYKIDKDTLTKIQKIFWSDYCTDVDTMETIRSIWLNRRYLIDPHTAVAVNVYEKYLLNTGDKSPTVIVSTASPFKFGSSVARAILGEDFIKGKNEFEILEFLSDKTGIPIPEGIKGLDKREVRHKTVTDSDKMEETVLAFLGI